MFAHGDTTLHGPDDTPGIDRYTEQLGFTYRLANEGTGIALNIMHGIEIAGRRESRSKLRNGASAS